MFRVKTLEGHGILKTRIDVFWLSTFSSSDLAKLVYFSAAEQVAAVQQQLHTHSWRPVGKEKATDEYDREGTKGRSIGKAYLCRLLRGIAWEKKENFRKQQCCMFGSEMDEKKQGCV